jgi:hypothetical protein
MAEQAGERRTTADVGPELITLMLPDVNPELVQLMLSRAARSAARGRADHEGHRGETGQPQTPQYQEYAELLALIRDADIDRAQLRAILGLDPETLLAIGDNPHRPAPETSPVQDLLPVPAATRRRCYLRLPAAT